MSIQHMCTKNMWADVNTNPVQGLLFRKFRHAMMGVPAEYKDDAKRRNMHSMLLPTIENERLTIPDKKLLKEIAVLVPAKRKLLPRRYQRKEYQRVVIASQFH